MRRPLRFDDDALYAYPLLGLFEVAGAEGFLDFGLADERAEFVGNAKAQPVDATAKSKIW